MKKTIITATAIIALAAASLQSARAGDREWATAGKVLTGVMAATVLAHAVAAPPSYATTYTYYSVPTPPPCAPAYCPPPAPPCAPVYCPPPAPPCVYYPAPAPRVVVIRNWAPANYHGAYVTYGAPVVAYPAPRVVYYASAHSRR